MNVETQAALAAPKTMNRYRVGGGIARFNEGQVIGLDDAQFKVRAHRLALIDRIEPKDGKKGLPFVVARVRSEIEFKVGEVISLPEIQKALVSVLEPLDEPQSEADKLAADTAAARGGGAKASAKRPALSPEYPDPIILIASTSKRNEVSVKQHEVIARILKDRGVSLAQWNSSSDGQRATAIAEMVDLMRNEIHEKTK